MGARLSLGEVKSILQQYTTQQQSFLGNNEPIGPLRLMWNEYSRCLNKENTASPLLRDYIRIISHFYEDAKKTKKTNVEQMTKALDNFSQGMDIPKAIKRSRIIKEDTEKSEV